MELDTLNETTNLQSEFAEQFGIPVSQLREMFNTWLPFVRVVALPPSRPSLRVQSLLAARGSGS